MEATVVYFADQVSNKGK